MSKTAAPPSLPVAAFRLESSLCICSTNRAAEQLLTSLPPIPPDTAVGHLLTDWLPSVASELKTWRDSGQKELTLDSAELTALGMRLSMQRVDGGNGREIAAVLFPLERPLEAWVPGTEPARPDHVPVSPYAEALLNTRGVLVVVLNPEGSLLRCNPAFEELTGYSEEALRKNSWFDLLVPRQRYPEVWSDLSRYRADTPPAEYACPILTAAGEERWIVWRNNVVQAEHRLRETVSVALDMTAQERLRRSEQQHRALLASLPQRIFFKDEAGRFVLVNKPFAADFGLTPAEFVGKTDADFFVAELAAKYRADDQLVMEKRQSYQFVETNRAAGVTRFVEVTKTPVVSDEGTIRGVLGIFTDVTGRKQMEEALTHERDLLHVLMDSLPDLIYFKDRESRFTRVNKALAAHLGLDDPRGAQGKSDFDIYPFQEASAFFEDERELFRTGQPLIGKTERVSPPGETPRWFSTTKVPLFDGNGQATGLVGVGRDITERIQAEAELQKAASELTRSNEELEQFAYVASHDLQEPLRMVASYTQLLERRYAEKLDDDGREFIYYAVDGATRMQGLIQDLLTYSRVGTRGKPFTWVDCNDVVERVQSHLQLAISDHRATVEVAPLPTVFGDPSQLMQLFQNLLGNAIKFHGEQPPHIRITAERVSGAEEEWLFQVRDNGIGIDPEYAEKIFVIFQRLHGKSEYPGSGIGLSICKKITQRHGGRIWVESAAGAGATFCFTLPATE